MRRVTSPSFLLCLALLATYSLEASASAEPAAKTAMARSGTWLIVSGTIKEMSRDRFTLDYGGGRIVVEMDGWDSSSNVRRLEEGSEVTVTGVVGEDFKDRRRIEASSVFVEGIYYYANPADEEGGHYAFPVEILAEDGSWITARGVVTKLESDAFTLTAGGRTIMVDVSAMADSPLVAEDGSKRLELGDRVSVFGKIGELEVFDPQKIRARSVVVLARDTEAQ